ncbi:type 1 glutamine amidotransferase domain-containing protein [Fimbriiglobus ruber]|uniref:ThiJ/PfpI family protein n=1 Tax=Fimbriiglobus ruber TaxID=1908690 RepID=A0A225CZD2_9BACT|nr:type 1 glutamine amidotransferase domain-containing protein [Fimbriiglobus ruber]OWK34612.1 ThiJ/PfpI family protein [Fimbriiglobus ruber]
MVVFGNAWLGIWVGAVALGIVGGLAAVATAAEPEVKGTSLKGKRVAVLVTDGFEQPEMVEPRKALDAAGAKTVLVSPKPGHVKAWNSTDWGDQFPVDQSLDDAKPDEFDALLLPGGVMNPDKLRLNPKAVQFVKAFAEAEKPIAAICHGPWTLIEADAVRGHTLTSWPSLQTDIRNAGGTWVDGEVVSDHGLVTSRKPSDIPAFNRAMIESFGGSKNRPAAPPTTKR